ncbi:MAG: transcriptional repressor [Chloroflexi bacterium]|nr:transcriptional repressor [Chloroflexota bacterium]
MDSQNGNGRSDLLLAIEDQGHRSTHARRLVAEAIEASAESFTAEEICEQLPSVGRATVYRTLKLFLSADALCKVALPDGAPRYAVDTGGRHHHHSICTNCGAVNEFRASTVERVLRALDREVDGEITGHRMEIFVRCDKCLSGAVQ